MKDMHEETGEDDERGATIVRVRLEKSRKGIDKNCRYTPVAEGRDRPPLRVDWWCRLWRGVVAMWVEDIGNKDPEIRYVRCKFDSVQCSVRLVRPYKIKFPRLRRRKTNLGVARR